MTCSSRTFWVLFLSFGVVYRLVLAAVTPLVEDEAYALTVAGEFSWSFYDHPPLSFWTLDAMYRLTGTLDPLVLRLPSLTLSLASLYLVYRLASMIAAAGPGPGAGAVAGRLSVLLFCIAPQWVFAAGMVGRPDPFLGFFVLLAVYLVAQVIQADRPSMRLWVGVGFALAGAMASKYHAIFIPIGALLFACIHPTGRKWFTTRGPYVACAIALLGLAPTLVWNIQNDWISFRFHADRATPGIFIENWLFLMERQVAYITAIGAIAMLGGFYYAIKHWYTKPVGALLATLAAPILLVFNALFLISTASLPHWTLPGWLLLLPVAGAWLASLRLPWFIAPAVVVTQALAAIGLLASTVYPTLDRTEFIVSALWNAKNPTIVLPHETDYTDLIETLVRRGDIDDETIVSIPGWVAAGHIGAALRTEEIGLDRIRLVPSHIRPEDSSGLGTRAARAALAYEPNHFVFTSGARASGRAIYLNPVIATTAKQNARARETLQHQLEVLRDIDPNMRELDPIVITYGDTPRVTVYMASFTWPDRPQ